MTQLSANRSSPPQPDALPGGAGDGEPHAKEFGMGGLEGALNATKDIDRSRRANAKIFRCLGIGLILAGLVYELVSAIFYRVEYWHVRIGDLPTPSRLNWTTSILALQGFPVACIIIGWRFLMKAIDQNDPFVRQMQPSGRGSHNWLSFGLLKGP